MSKLTLHLPEVMHVLDSKPMVVVFAEGMTDIVPASHKGRRLITAPWLAMMHKAEKFIFDSGSDQDQETTTAVRETAVSMIEAGLFHLPYPICWIEDPYNSDDPTSVMRNYYLCEEKNNGITIRFMQRFDPMVDMQDEIGHVPPETLRGIPGFMMHAHVLGIDLRTAKDEFAVLGARGKNPLTEKVLGEAVYALKKFIVTLATEQAIRERVTPARERSGGEKRFRSYPHTIIRIPSDRISSDADGGSGTGKKRRWHLVRGFMWGRNTRPKEEQRWVAPYFRGDPSIGIAPRASHHVVEKRPIRKASES